MVSSTPWETNILVLKQIYFLIKREGFNKTDNVDIENLNKQNLEDLVAQVEYWETGRRYDSWETF